MVTSNTNENGVLATDKEEFHNIRVISRYLILLVDVIVGIVSGVFSYYLLLKYSLITLPSGVPYYVALAGAAMIGTLVASLLLQTYRELLRFGAFSIGLRMLTMYGVNAFIFALSFWALCEVFTLHPTIGFVFFVTLTYAVAFFVLYSLYRAVAIVAARRLWRVGGTTSKSRERVLIFGVSEEGSKLVNLLRESPKYELLGFCHKGDWNSSAMVGTYPVYRIENREELKQLAQKHRVDAIVFCNKGDLLRERGVFIHECTELGIKTMLAPEIHEKSPLAVAMESVHNINMEDLLEREVIHHEEEKVKARYEGKVVMVTGAAGSIGSELVLQIAALKIKQLILLDIAETPLHNIRLKLQELFPDLDFVPVLGDVRSQKRLSAIFERYRPQIVLHAAAYKHVPLLEENPCEGVMANVQGSKNVADYCLKYGVERMVMVSTDKAVNPTNVLGASKRAAEIYVQALGKAVEEGKVEGKTIFITTRFGNVLGSQGSVIPLFRDQIAKGGPITVTHPDINRYFMSVHEACSLILEASAVAENTTIFVFDMGEPHKIVHLAENMIYLAGLEPYKDIKIVFTGLRPGEKLYEEKLADGENTIPTTIPKIHIAKVREHNYADLYDTFEALRDAARMVHPEECVRLLKALIPEYISAPNSPFAPLDKSTNNM